MTARGRVLLVADLPGSTHGLDPVAAQLARERRVVAIDPPGHGLSSPAPAGTTDGGVELVARAVAALGLGQVDVAGINVGRLLGRAPRQAPRGRLRAIWCSSTRRPILRP